jgi:hypothetical protein
LFGIETDSRRRNTTVIVIVVPAVARVNLTKIAPHHQLAREAIEKVAPPR